MPYDYLTATGNMAIAYADALIALSGSAILTFADDLATYPNTTASSIDRSICFPVNPLLRFHDNLSTAQAAAVIKFGFNSFELFLAPVGFRIYT